MFDTLPGFIVLTFLYISRFYVFRCFPQDTSPYVIPRWTLWIRMWDMLMILLAVYHFLEVPVRISFQLTTFFAPNHHLTWGSYVLSNICLDLLLTVDMFLNMFRSYVSDNSATVWDLK